jgi:hypothetical protein
MLESGGDSVKSCPQLASNYREAGLAVLPADLREKRPAVRSWKEYQRRLPTADEVNNWFPADRPMCVVCGAVSGNLEMIDFDFGGELFDRWYDAVTQRDGTLLNRVVIERSQSGGRHVAYRSQDPVCKNLKLAQRKLIVDGPEEIAVAGKTCRPRRDAGGNWHVLLTLIETRGEGGLFLCYPTSGYELVQGDFTQLPVLTTAERETLLIAAWELNEFQPDTIPIPSAGLPSTSLRPGDDFNQRGDVRDLLRRHGWTLVRTGDNEYWRRPGKTSGWSATLKDNLLYVHSMNAAPFEDDVAYAPFSVFTLLEHHGDYAAAASALRQRGFGDDDPPQPASDVNIDNLTARFADEPVEREQTVADPGPIPENLFRVPGFVSTVMDFTLANAPYPNIGLAFCGAMALQSFLAGRKVSTSGDLRTNIYLLALASSGTGKEFPRKVNSRVLLEVGMVSSLGDKFASGEGIQDALVRNSAMLFQNDEMDGVLRQINLDRENSRESIPNILLTLYTSANDVYPIRVKAGQKEAVHIDQPHLTLFGTATPQCFYESLSLRMLSNGFFARMIVIDVGNRGAGQTPGSARDLPATILDVARWWANYRPGNGNLRESHPQPRVVPFDAEATQAIDRLRRMTETEYDQAQQRQDEVGRAVWSRTCENAKKLALIYACSENHEHPVIDLPAAEWATMFAIHQTRRQLFLAEAYVAENPFHGECLKVIRKLREAGGQMARRELIRVMRCKAADFDQLVGTLLQTGDIVPVEIPTRTKPAQGFRLP